MVSDFDCRQIYRILTSEIPAVRFEADETSRRHIALTVILEERIHGLETYEIHMLNLNVGVAEDSNYLARFIRCLGGVEAQI